MVQCTGKALRCPLLTRFLQNSSYARLEEVRVSAKDWEKKSDLNANVVSQNMFPRYGVGSSYYHA